MTAETARDLGDYFQRCNRTAWTAHHGAASLERRRMLSARCGRRAEEAIGNPERTEIYLAFVAAAATRFPGSKMSDWIKWPEAADFDIAEADLEV